MKKIIFVCAMLLSFLYSAGQDFSLLKKMENADLQVRQKPGTDAQFAAWMANEGVDEDTIYAFIYVPASCPRCELGITTYSKYLKEKGRKFTLISVLPDKTVAEFYNRKKGYAADYYIYDTADRYKSILSFNNIALNSPVMMKITKEGRLITGFDGMYFYKKLGLQLLAQDEPMPYKDFNVHVADEHVTWKYPIEKAVLSELGRGHRDYRLDVPADAPLCEIFRNPYFSGDMFFYPDEVLGTVSMFRKSAADDSFSFAGSMGAADEEKNMFVDVDSVTLRSLTENGNLFYIVCNAAMLDSSHIGLSFSLPRVFYESNGNLAIYNQACILPRRMPGMESEPCLPLEFPMGDDKFFYQHFQFCSTGSRLIMGCEKFTWASSFNEGEYKSDVRYNSFMPGFYDTETSFMVEVDRSTGLPLRRFGRLDSVARKTLTGYYYVSPLATVGGSELAYTDGYSGKVYVADTSDVAVEKNCYSIFEIADADLPPVDTAMFYTYEYAKPFRSVFCRQIEDVRVTPGKIYCIVAYGDMSDPNDKRTRRTFVTVDRSTGERREYLYPQEAGWTVFTRGLREKDGCVYPFSVLKHGGEALLRVYGEDGAEL